MKIHVCNENKVFPFLYVDDWYSPEEEKLLSQDCSKDSSYFTEIDDGNKPLTSIQQLNLISNKLNKYIKRIKNKYR